MKVFYGVNQAKKLKNPVVSLGVFDGVHKGHINILKSTVIKARKIKGASVAVTFWPHPQKELSLYSLAHRLRLFEKLGIDACLVIKFSESFAKIPAESFIKEILIAKLKARYIYVGKNFRFGKFALGNRSTLSKLSFPLGYKLRVFNVIKTQNKKISSTYIRKLIACGNLRKAKNLLTRPVSILGSVMPGNFLGRKLGYPTANINPHHEVIPPSGIYAVKVVFREKILKGVCYIGTRPTLMNSKEKIQNPKTHIEVHIFNFNKNIYGEYLEIQFIKKIREDKKFKNLNLLSRQITKDSESARRLLSSH